MPWWAASVFRTVMFYGNKLYVFKTYNCVPLYWHKAVTFKLVELIGMQNWREECLSTMMNA